MPNDWQIIEEPDDWQVLDNRVAGLTFVPWGEWGAEVPSAPSEEPRDDELERISKLRQEYLDATKQEEQAKREKYSAYTETEELLARSQDNLAKSYKATGDTPPVDLSREPTTKELAMPEGQRPTMFNRETGQWEEVDPKYSDLGLSVPLGKPRGGGGDPRTEEGGVISDSTPWQDRGAQVKNKPKTYASNQPGVPDDWQTEEPTDWQIQKPTSWREDIMSELDSDPATKRLAMQMLDTEGGGVATMEALVNRVAMIRERVRGWTIKDELNSGFYGPIKRGYAQTLNLHPNTVARYQQDIDEVRAGSNVIRGRTDQGYPGDPNWRGPGRVHVANNPKEVYNYWAGRRRGAEFSHGDSARFAGKMLTDGPKFADTNSDSAKRAIIEEREPNDWQVTPPEPNDWQEIPDDKPAITPNQTRTATNRNRLSTAIADVEKAGYTVPHFIGTEDEPEGDRGPTRDMESLVKALALQEENAIRAGKVQEAARIRQERSYWEDHIKKYGMSAEQWKKQTGEEDPRYPHEPAFQAKQSPSELIDSVQSAINAGKEWWQSLGGDKVAKVGLSGLVTGETPKSGTGIMDQTLGSVKRGLMSSGLGLGETINRYAYSPIVHGLREAIDYIAPGSDLAKHAATFDDAFYENTVAKPAAQRAQLGKESAGSGVVGEVAHSAGQLAGDLLPILLTSGVLPKLQGGIELVNALRHGAASMTIPAMRAGADEAEAVKAKGGSEIEQLGAFIKATTITMGLGAIPMATSSGAPSLAGRFAERTAKAIPLGSATVEAGRMAENLVSSVTGGEQKPFSLKENILGTIPMAILGGAAGRNTSAKRRIVSDIQATAESAGVKVTPEQVEAFVGKPKSENVEAQAKAMETPIELGAVANPKAVKGVEMAKTEAKRSADFVRGLPKWNDYIKNILTWSADNAKDKFNTRKLQESMMKDIPENVRDAIPNWIEAGGDAMELAKRAAATKNIKLRKGYEDAAKFGPEEVAVAQSIKQRYDDYVALAKSEGIDIQRIQNYVTHMWKNPDLAGTGYTRGLSSYFKYAKQRSYPDFFTGEQAGEVPKTKDIAKLLPIYENALNDAINAKRLAKSLQTGKASDGRPLVDKIKIMSSDKGLGYKTIENNPAFNGLVVHPEIHLKLSRAVGQSKLREWLDSPSDNPFTEYGKGAFRAMEDAQAHMKATTFSLSPFHQVHLGKHSGAHLVNPLKHLFTEGVNPNDPYTYYAMKHGLMVAPDTVSQHHFLEGVGAGQKNLVTKALRKAGMDKGADLIDGYTSYLFERFIPALKLDTFGKVMGRNQKRYAKELESGKVTLDQVASRTADEINASYGHLNYVKMGRSPTVQHWLQIALLAPDFFEARVRYAAQGAQGLMGSKSTEQMMSLAGMAVALYVLARTANQLDHGDAEWDPENAFKFVRGNKSWGIRSVPGDIHDVIFKGVGRFIHNRISPLAGRGVLNLLTGENWRGEKTDFGKTITEMISNTVPMPLQGYSQKFTEQERAQSITPMEKFMQSWGFQVSRHSPITVTHNLARDWMKTNDPKRYNKLENSDFPESKYRALRYALEDSDEDGAREQAKKLGPDTGKGFQQSVLNPFTGSNASDQKFYDSLSEHDKLLFEAAIKRRALILDRYRQWVGPLGTKTDVSEAGLYRRMRDAKMKKAVLPDEQP